ncbi:transcription factor VOZ1-like [Pistacia vera]|uniref:transcription factor VOZ1-like n=1 Tax=Pistacia vera TaxID=55513 RepID=UPI001263B3C3|nr:transcription factor VOZ1-like [Pistacia vera]XP_031273933.1 transcription factor VOZ1-like [Pistacia vera]
MMSGSKSKCGSASHQLLMDNSKNRLNDLQERFSSLRTARKDGRVNDVVVLEEQVNQILREWNSELSAPSPASSLLGGSLGSFSDDIGRLLQLSEEQDDATSPLAELMLKPQPDVQGLHPGAMTTFQEDYLVNNELQEHCFQGSDGCKGSTLGMHNIVGGVSDITSQLDYSQLNLHQELEHGLLVGACCGEEFEKDAGSNILLNICPPSAFMGPKCALWDCTRPALGSEWYRDYCSCFHATLASNEDSPGRTPVLRPGGINLKDNLLFVAANAKAQGKNVGIPHCEGAANTKSPWNATELFDLFLLKGETIREWLFFDKRRRAFESGTRKQRSLPDHSGRGWHESRKQVMKEFGGQKRSYYMDPQPSGSLEWHLYEYELNSCDAYALYRLELKLVDEKKSPKVKVTKDSLADLQKKMGQLTAEVPADTRSSVKGNRKTNKNVDKNVDSAKFNSSPGDITSTTEVLHQGSSGIHKLLADSLTDDYDTYEQPSLDEETN